jgi:aryl-alcohol dehydrogenase-like predicted oxidoreductase
MSYSKTDATSAIVSRVEEIAKKRQVSMAQVSLAWIMSKDHVTAPIVGSTSVEHLKDVVGG